MSEKLCKFCGQIKSEDNFALRGPNYPGKRSGRCKACMVKYTQEKVRENTLYLMQYLAEHPCVDCGESDIEVLEFDHLQPYGPGNRGVFGWRVTRKRMIEEINRCEVRCSNCHTRKTRRDWYTLRSELLSSTA